MGASHGRDAYLVLQVRLLGFISGSATPFAEDFGLCSPLSWWEKRIIPISATCKTVLMRGKIGKRTD